MFQVDSQRPAVKIATFNHGTFNPKKKRKIKLKSYKQDDGKKKKRFLIGQTDTCCYVGKNFGDMFSSSKMYSHYVGIFNKSTGKIQICDADLFYLNPYFPQAEQKTEEPSTLSHFEKRSRLIEAFGGKKSKQLIENRQRTIVEGDVLKDAIDGALKETMRPENSRAIEIRATVEDSVISDLIPPCNIHAESVHDVYKLDDIISPADMAQLSEHSQDIFDTKPKDVAELIRNETYCQFVLEHILNLTEDLVERQKLANCLLYFQYLVELYKMKSAVLKSKEIFTVFPEFIVTSFIRCSFISDTKNLRGRWERRCSSYQKDKIAVYLIVFALLLDDFKTSVRPIMEDLKMGRVKISCQVNKELLDLKVVIEKKKEEFKNYLEKKLNKEPSSILCQVGQCAIGISCRTREPCRNQESRVRKEGSRVRQEIPEEGRRAHRLKRCTDKDKDEDEDISPNNPNNTKNRIVSFVLLKLFGYVGCRIVQEKGEKELKKQCAVLKVPLQLKYVTKRKLRNS